MKQLNWKPNSEMAKAGLKLVRLLNKSGYQAFFVGGYVRDLITKHDSDNLDIATDALPGEVEKILDKEGIFYKQIGKKFGTILAVAGGNPIEITTFRKESRYSDQRHPDQVEFIREYLEDARRRDLTINAMYFNPISKQIFDPVNGRQDLTKKIVRFVGDPKKRIDEDPLRMLRAVRFAATLGFKIEKNSFAAMKTRAKLIQGISGERIKQELDKILLAKSRDYAFDLLDSSGLLRFIIPDLPALKKVFHGSKKFHLEGSVYVHTMKVMEGLPQDLILLYSGLFHDIGKVNIKIRMMYNGEMVNRFFGHQKESAKIFRKFAARCPFSRQSRELIEWLVIRHDDRLTYREMKESTRVAYSLHPDFDKLIDLWRADSAGNLRLDENGIPKWGDSDSAKIGKKYLARIASCKKILDRFSSGDFIMQQTKLPPGIQIGEISKKIKLKIVLGEIKNETDAKNFLKKFAKST